ncbi:MAG: GNAT family N-acetyltransferase [Bacteroidota bacterium]
MEGLIIRDATINDIPFLVETIIEAEKSGTDKLSYSTVFGLSGEESRKYIADMLSEEIDGCELSISSFIIAEINGQIAAAVAAWIEGTMGIPSAILKGNLLNFILPKESIVSARMLNLLLKELHIECISGTMQLGLVYVKSSFRGLNLVRLLIDAKIKKLLQINPHITEMYVQVFGNNLPAIRVYEKADFKIVTIKESLNEKILHYLPSNKKILMKKELYTNLK